MGNVWGIRWPFVAGVLLAFIMVVSLAGRGRLVQLPGVSAIVGPYRSSGVLYVPPVELDFRLVDEQGRAWTDPVTLRSSFFEARGAYWSTGVSEIDLTPDREGRIRCRLEEGLMQEEDMEPPQFTLRAVPKSPSSGGFCFEARDGATCVLPREALLNDDNVRVYRLPDEGETFVMKEPARYGQILVRSSEEPKIRCEIEDDVDRVSGTRFLIRDDLPGVEFPLGVPVDIYRWSDASEARVIFYGADGTYLDSHTLHRGSRIEVDLGRANDIEITISEQAYPFAKRVLLLNSDAEPAKGTVLNWSEFKDRRERDHGVIASYPVPDLESGRADISKRLSHGPCFAELWSIVDLPSGRHGYALSATQALRESKGVLKARFE